MSAHQVVKLAKKLDVKKLNAQADKMQDINGDGAIRALNVAYRTDPEFHEATNRLLKLNSQDQDLTLLFK